MHSKSEQISLLTTFFYKRWSSYVKVVLLTQIRAYARIQQQRRHFNHSINRISCMKHGVAQIKHRLKQALRSDMSNDSYKSGLGDKPDSPDPRVTRGFGIDRSD